MIRNFIRKLLLTIFDSFQVFTLVVTGGFKIGSISHQISKALLSIFAELSYVMVWILRILPRIYSPTSLFLVLGCFSEFSDNTSFWKHITDWKKKILAPVLDNTANVEMLVKTINPPSNNILTGRTNKPLPTINISFGLILFYGISTIVGYLIPFYTDISNIWFLNTFCR